MRDMSASARPARNRSSRQGAMRLSPAPFRRTVNRSGGSGYFLEQCNDFSFGDRDQMQRCGMLCTGDFALGYRRQEFAGLDCTEDGDHALEADSQIGTPGGNFAGPLNDALLFN